MEKTIIEIAPVEEEKTEPLPPPPAVQKVEVPKVQTIKLTTPVVVDNANVEPPPTQAEIAEARISNITQAGIKDIDVVVPPDVIDGNKGIVASPKIVDDADKIFEKVEIDASYPGGSGAWKNFLERNLRVETPVDNGASPGVYTVYVQFVVDKNGNVSELKALTNIGFGMEAEAIRVVKKSGRWKPAIQNGNAVKAYRKQPVTFQVLEQ